MVATMCSRCAWVSDGEFKIPIWKWLHSKGRGITSRDFFLKNEQAGLRIRIAEIERELSPRATLIIDGENLRAQVRKLRVDE